MSHVHGHSACLEESIVSCVTAQGGNKGHSCLVSLVFASFVFPFTDSALCSFTVMSLSHDLTVSPVLGPAQYITGPSGLGDPQGAD
jgi:hypothetical protein